MPTIGNVEVPDILIRKEPEQTARPRPTLGDIFSASAESAIGQVRYGLPYAFDRATSNEIDPETERGYKEGLARAAVAGARVAPASVDEVMTGRVNPLRFAIENLTASLPQTGAILAGGVAGGLAGGPGGALAGALTVGTPLFVGSNTARAVEEQGSLTDEGAERAIALAPVQAGADALVGRFLPGAGKFFGKLGMNTGEGFVKNTVKSVFKAGMTEAATEAAQQVGERYAAGLPTGNVDAAKEYVNAAVTAFAVGGLLGSAGGFRRSAATDKPPAMVETADIANHVDQMLGQRQLPSPQMFGRNPQGPTVEAGGPAVAVDAYGRQAQGVPALSLSPLGFEPPSPEEAVGFVRPGPLAADVSATQAPRPVVPNTEEGATVLANLPVASDVYSTNQEQTLEAAQGRLNALLAQVPTTTPQGPQVSAAALTGTPVGATPSIGVEADARPLRDADMADLRKVAQSRAESPEAQPFIMAAQNELAIRAQEEEDAKFNLDTLKQGLRGGFVQNVEATTAEELADKVYTQIFEEQDTRSNTSKFAQRVGLLDENLQPTELAKTIEARRAAALAPDAQPAITAPQESTPGAVPERRDASVVPPTAPAAPTTTASVAPAPVIPAAPVQRSPEAEQAVGQYRPAKPMGVTKTIFDSATDEADLRRKVSVALGEGTPSPQLEAVARKLGVVTDDPAMDFTPAGRTAYLQTSQGFEDIVTAGRDQGYEGRQASVFERGARSVIEGVAAPQSFDNFSDMAAHKAGETWAKSYIENTGRGRVRTQAETEAFTEQTITGETVRTRDREGERQLTPRQVEQRTIHNLLQGADMTGVPDDVQANLHKMVKEGATADEVGEALQAAQGGQMRFKQPARRESTFTPATVSRGQPLFKEMAGTPAQASKTTQRAEAKHAIEVYELRNLIDFAAAERGSGIGAVKAAKLHELLDNGEVARVRNVMKGFIDETNALKDRRGTDRQNDLAFEQAITGKSFTDVAKHMAENAPSPFYRELMVKVRQLGQMLEKYGMMLDIRVVAPTDLDVPVELELPGTKALTHTRYYPQASATIYLKNAEHGPDAAINYQTAAHEMTHAVTKLLVAYGRDVAQYGKTQIGKATQELDKLMEAVRQHFESRLNGTALLSDFERRYLDRDNNALDDADELLAWGLTNPEMQRYLNGIQFAPRQSVFSRLVEAVRTLLGMEPRYDGALAELLRVSEKIFATPRAELSNILVRNNPNATIQRFQPVSALRDEAVSARNRTVEASNETLKQLAAAADQFVGNLNPQDFKARARAQALGWFSHNHLNRLYAELLPSLVEHSDAQGEYNAVRTRFEQVGTEAFNRFDSLPPKVQGWVRELMMTTTTFQVDPDKAWEAHDHHIAKPDREGKKDPKSVRREAEMRAIHAKAVELRDKLSRGDAAGKAMFDELRTLNEAQNYARMAAALHQRIATDRELMLGVADSEVNPIDEFMRSDVVTPTEWRDQLRDLLNKQLLTTQAYIDQRRGGAGTPTPNEAVMLQQQLAPIESFINGVRDTLKTMTKAPYFHLARFGDYFGSFTIRKGADGRVDPAALAHVAEVMDKAGFGYAQLSEDNTNPFMRAQFEKVDQTQAFAALARDLKQQGWLQADTDIQAGARERGNFFGLSESLPDYIRSYIAAIENHPMYAPDEGMSDTERVALEKQKVQAVQLAVDAWVELQPDNSISKVLVKRNTSAGADKDMMRGWLHRWRVGSLNIANAAAAPKFYRALSNMKSQVEEAKRVVPADEKDANGQPVLQKDPVLLSQLYSEIRKRDATSPLNEIADNFDKARAVAHAYFLGLSPAYGLINLTQLGVLGLPELAKKHGYSKSFHAMRRSSAIAMKVMQAAWAEAKSQGPRHFADVVLSNKVLESAGLTADERKFMTRMIATGSIDFGSAARAFGQLAETGGDSKLGTSLKYASVIGLYSETFNRLTMALSARELHGGYGEDAVRYAAEVVDESMLDYDAGNTARMMGRQGFAGPLTPMLVQFMSYSVQVTEKLYSEIANAIGTPRPGETAEQTKARAREARRFMLGHLTAITALAGTLGLPFATVFATVIERLVDLFGDDEDEPYDATASWRNFLAGVFGVEAAEVLSRGLPRALGFDLSARAGEQNLLPFSEFFADRRSWQEAVNNSAGRSLGAVPSMATSILDGGSQIANGDILAGMKAVLPVAFKGPTEAFRMTGEGYVDSKGNKLPMSPTASSILYQLIGFNPSEKAEYSEARGDQAARRGELSRTAGRLRQGIMRAMLSGDEETARKLVGEAIEFDKNNPAFGVIEGLQGALQRQQKTQAMATALRAPVGVSVKDIAGQRMTRYANVDYAAQ